jgi:hypothetical protein
VVTGHGYIWFAGLVSKSKGGVPPEPIDYVPDAKGSPPVQRALIPPEGSLALARNAALHRKSKVFILCA